MDHLPSNYSPFRQQLEGSWFRSHLNSSAWHTSFQCAVVCVDAHRSVCPLHVGQDGTIARRHSRSTLTEVCVHSGSRRHRIARRRSRSTLTEVCVHSGSRRHRIARRRPRSTLTEVCVSTVGQDGMHMAGSTHETYGNQARQCQITGGFKQSGPHQSGQQYV